MSYDKPLLTMSELETTITYNLEKLEDARVRKEDELCAIFENRMNSALDDYQDVLYSIGKVAVCES